MDFNDIFYRKVFVGALAGSALTATAIVMKNNLAAVVKGAFVGSLIVGAAIYRDKHESDLKLLEYKIEQLSSRLEQQSADVASTPN